MRLLRAGVLIACVATILSGCTFRTRITKYSAVGVKPARVGYLDDPSKVVPTSLDGKIELGQTHLIRQNEMRYAPALVSERDALFLYTPEVKPPSSLVLVVSAQQAGKNLGSIPLYFPQNLIGHLEDGISNIPLAPERTDAYS